MMQDDEPQTLLDREIEETLDFNAARTRLTTVESDLLMRAFDSLEETLAGDDLWELTIPKLFIVRSGGADALGMIGSVVLCCLDFPGWGVDPGATVESLAVSADRSPAVARLLVEKSGATAALPVVAVAMVSEGWARKPGVPLSESVNLRPELRVDETRQLVAVDVDARVYSVVRWRKAGRRRTDVVTDQKLRRSINEATDPDIVALRETHEEGMPRTPRVLGRLASALYKASATH